jgi:hypothetical protein
MNGVPGEPVPLKLRFLTDDESMRNFATRYWTAHYGTGVTFFYPENVGDLVGKFGFTLNEGLCKLAEVVVASCGSCPRCGGPIVVRNRTDLYRHAAAEFAPVCQSCLDREWAEQEKAQEQLRQKECQERQRRIQEAEDLADQQYAVRSFYLEKLYGQELPRVDARMLTLEDAVYLHAVFRASKSEKLTVLPPLEIAFTKIPIAPSNVESIAVIKYLSDRNLIAPSPRSDHDAFIWNGDLPKSYLIFKVIWRVAPAIDESTTLIEQIQGIFRTGDWPEIWHARVLPLWRHVALHECIQYLQHQLSRHRMPFSPGNKTRIVIEDGLTTYSISQMYTAIFRTVKDAAAFYVEKSPNVSLGLAANTVISRIKSFIDRARAEKWPVFRRPPEFECQPTMVRKVLFDVLLKFGHDGFDATPSEVESVGT